MKNFFSRMNPTLRGFLVIAVIALIVVVLQLEATLAALVIVVLQLEATLVALLLLARIAFLLAIAFFVYLLWRERREEIGSWP
ncbi:MAG TPA: hypothetical protein VKC62_03330, partial [Gaiellaceae bacterium]|nr:hypothetical protein [Gaiellaceae bacterium]